MARQEEGWPLGLQPLNARVGLVRNNGGDNNLGSVSFNTLLTGSPTSSTDSSSDLDTEVFKLLRLQYLFPEKSCVLPVFTLVCRILAMCILQSTGSFFHDKSITLGSLIGVSSILELSKRSLRGRKAEAVAVKEKKSGNKSRSWLFSLCPRDTTDAANVNRNNPPSLGHFLAVERRAANNGCGRSQSPNLYGPDDQMAMAQPSFESNSLFINGRIAPPRASPWRFSDAERRDNGGLEPETGNGCGIPALFSCMCGQSSH
ncbi:hypothetical protein WN944_028057 [Citrus x changshan-huyou]|uniref:Uncharacterized protein n=1 Tax=Citrus x changshan-huyou TaxID=2935761 RepID=A0AAP0QAF6_9ROSI